MFPNFPLPAPPPEEAADQNETDQSEEKEKPDSDDIEEKEKPDGDDCQKYCLDQ